jgi:hypothetical protein
MKKGASQMTYIVIFGLIGLIILALLFSSPVVNFIANKFPNLIPSYNTIQPPSDSPETLRYNIAIDKVEYSDGANWIPFPEDWNQKIKIGTKEMTHSQARYSFAENYFFNAEKRTKERIPLSGLASSVIYKGTENPQLYPTFYCIYFRIPKGGEVVIDLLQGDKEKFLATGEKVCTGVSFGVFYLKLDGKLFFAGINQENFESTGQTIIKQDSEDVTTKWPSLYEEVAPQAAEWRDSVLSQPMCFCYNNECKTFEVKQNSNYPNAFLVADLTKPLGECTNEQ